MKPTASYPPTFLKLDATYMQHWAPLFPGNLAKGDAVPHPTELPEPGLLLASRGMASPRGPGPMHGPPAKAPILERRTCASPSPREEAPPHEHVQALPFTAEEVDYYLYGQQCMEIIPVNSHDDPHMRES